MSRPLWALAVSAALLLPGSASSAGDAATVLTATRVRAGLHPAFVRAVVDFSGGSFGINDVDATDPNPFDGATQLELRRTGARTTAAALTAFGIQVTVARGGPGLVIRLTAAPRRFKYVSYAVLTAPQRLAIDLWTAARPPAARFGRPGCITLTSFSISPTVARASGGSFGLFENSLVVRLRGARGGVNAQRPVTASETGSWSATVPYRSPAQAGTLEAVALSAKDGSLDCLVQVPVTLGA